MKRKLFLLLCALLTSVGMQQVKADTSLLDGETGWQKITELPGTLSDYYFTIVDNSSDLMLTLSRGQNQSGAYNGLYYKTSGNPLNDKSMLFTLEANGDHCVMTNVEYNGYFLQTEYNAAQNYRTHDNGGGDKSWGNVDFKYQGGGFWTIQNGKYSEDDGNYLGVWNDGVAAANGQELALNKANSNRGTYQIYAILKTDAQAYWDEVAAGTGASVETPVDMTSLIVNPNARFWTGSIPFGWTTTGTQNVNNGAGYDQFPGIFEYSNWGANSWTGSLQQTITVPNGKYLLKAAFMAATGVTAYLYANDDHSEDLVPSGDTGGNINPDGSETTPGEGQRGWKYLTVQTTVTNGSLTLGTYASAGTAHQWVNADNFTLSYLGESLDDYEIPLANAKTAAKDIDQDAPMNADVLSALQSALSLYGDKTFESYTTVDEITTAISALNTAANNASSSITAYASVNISAYLTKMAGVLDNTNVYTTEAYNKWYGNVQTNYDSGLYTNDEVIQLTANGAYSDGWHSNNTIGNILLSSWTIGGNQCYKFDTPLYINTWSVEGASDGSNFLAPFFEYWVSSGSLAPNTIVATVEGLKASTTYSFTIRARVQGTAEKIANGVTMKVGNGETVDISSGTKFSTTDFYIGNFTAVGETDASGKMTMTMTVAENSNISWLSFYNCNYVEGEDLSAYIADYEFARDNAVAAQSKPMDISKKEELDDAIDDYGSLNTATATKSELIDAKEALEDALAVVTPSIAALAGSDLSLWTTTGNNGNFEVNTWSNEGATDGSNMTKPFIQNWKGAGNILGEAVMSYEMTDQTPGYYRVRGLVRTLVENGSAIPTGSFFFANDALQRVYNGSDCTNGKYKNADVYGYVGDDGVLTIGVKIIKGNFNWVSWKNLSVEYVGTTLTQAMADNLTAEARTFTYNTAAQETEDAAVDALSTLSNANYVAAGQAIETAYRAYDRDYSALISAITEKEGYVLGFLTDEYAPYSGIEAAYATATAIDQNSEATSQDDIDAAATALSSISANATEVNAFFDGAFASDYSHEGNVMPIGWHGVGSHDNATDVRLQWNYETNPGLNATPNKQAGFLKFTGIYGNETGYTLPLKAGVYALSFIYGGWNEQGTRVIKVYSATDNSIEATVAPSSVTAKDNQAHTTPSSWSEYEGYVVIPSDGDYIFSFYRENTTNQNQLAFSDIELVKAPANYSANLKVSNGKLGTFIAPFDITLPAGVKAYSATATGTEVKLTKIAEGGELAAGTPVIIYGDEVDVDETFYGVPTVTENQIDGALTGILDDSNKAISSGNYVLQTQDDVQAFYRLANNATGKLNRCYVTAGVSGNARLVISIDDDPTAINAIEAADAETEGLKDGKYLIENKIVLVKNGVKYSANGQKLN